MFLSSDDPPSISTVSAYVPEEFHPVGNLGFSPMQIVSVLFPTRFALLLTTRSTYLHVQGNIDKFISSSSPDLELRRHPHIQGLSSLRTLPNLLADDAFK